MSETYQLYLRQMLAKMNDDYPAHHNIKPGRKSDLVRMLRSNASALRRLTLFSRLHSSRASPPKLITITSTPLPSGRHPSKLVSPAGKSLLSRNIGLSEVSASSAFRTYSQGRATVSALSVGNPKLPLSSSPRRNTTSMRHIVLPTINASRANYRPNYVFSSCCAGGNSSGSQPSSPPLPVRSVVGRALCPQMFCPRTRSRGGSKYRIRLAGCDQIAQLQREKCEIGIGTEGDRCVRRVDIQLPIMGK